jgi:hypothetical protein
VPSMSAKNCRGILTVRPNLHGCWAGQYEAHCSTQKPLPQQCDHKNENANHDADRSRSASLFRHTFIRLRHTDTQARLVLRPVDEGAPFKSKLYSQDLTLQAILSNGVATVMQILSRVFSVMAAERAEKGRKLAIRPVNDSYASPASGAVVKCEPCTL